MIAKHNTRCLKCRNWIVEGMTICFVPQFKTAIHKNCKLAEQCPECNIRHGKDESCYGGFDPDRN